MVKANSMVGERTTSEHFRETCENSLIQAAYYAKSFYTVVNYLLSPTFSYKSGGHLPFLALAAS